MPKKVKVDLRKTLRAIGTNIQDENLSRLLTGESVSGGIVDPKKTPAEKPTKATRKRVRIHGVRTKLAELQGRLGVQSGDMLKDVSRRSNVKVGRTTVKVTPGADVRSRWFAFNAGTKHQAARPVSGMSDAQLKAASDDLARDAREQLVRGINEAKRQKD